MDGVSPMSWMHKYMRRATSEAERQLKNEGDKNRWKPVSFVRVLVGATNKERAGAKEQEKAQ